MTRRNEIAIDVSYMNRVSYRNLKDFIEMTIIRRSLA